MRFDMNKMMKQVQAMQAEMQRRLEEAREKLRSAKVVGSAGGGLVEVEMNGERELIRVSVKPEALSALGITSSAQNPASETDVYAIAQELSDLVFAATNSALAQAQKLNEEIMSSVQPVPGMDFSNLSDLINLFQGC